jgi:hypothetical protein
MNMKCSQIIARHNKPCLQKAGSQANDIHGQVFKSGPVLKQVDVFDITTGDVLVDESPPSIWPRGNHTITIALPAWSPVYMEPGWLAVDGNGDLSKHVRAKLLNSTANITASGALNYSAIEPTTQGMPYVIRCASFCITGFCKILLSNCDTTCRPVISMQMSTSVAEMCHVVV